MQARSGKKINWLIIHNFLLRLYLMNVIVRRVGDRVLLTTVRNYGPRHARIRRIHRYRFGKRTLTLRHTRITRLPIPSGRWREIKICSPFIGAVLLSITRFGKSLLLNILSCYRGIYEFFFEFRVRWYHLFQFLSSLPVSSFHVRVLFMLKCKTKNSSFTTHSSLRDLIEKGMNIITIFTISCKRRRAIKNWLRWNCAASRICSVWFASELK